MHKKQASHAQYLTLVCGSNLDSRNFSRQYRKAWLDPWHDSACHVAKIGFDLTSYACSLLLECGLHIHLHKPGFSPKLTLSLSIAACSELLIEIPHMPLLLHTSCVVIVFWELSVCYASVLENTATQEEQLVMIAIKTVLQVEVCIWHICCRSLRSAKKPDRWEPPLIKGEPAAQSPVASIEKVCNKFVNVLWSHILISIYTSTI